MNGRRFALDLLDGPVPLRRFRFIKRSHRDALIAPAALRRMRLTNSPHLRVRAETVKSTQADAVLTPHPISQVEAAFNRNTWSFGCRRGWDRRQHRP